jgi:hypothetical protein
MTKSALNKILNFEADEIVESALETISQSLAEGQAHGSPRPTQALTLDERSNLYLNAVCGSRDFTSDEYAEARESLLDAMAANFRAPHEPNVPDLNDSNSLVDLGRELNVLSEMLQVQDAPHRKATLASHAAASSIPRSLSRGSSSFQPLFEVEDSALEPGYPPSIGTSSVRKESRPRRARLRLYSAIAATVLLILTSSAVLYLLLVDSKQQNTFADLSSEQLNSVLSQHSMRDATSFKRNSTGSAFAQRLLDLGNRLIASGDLYGGRIVLAEAADEGSGSAALNLGSSFDPSEDGSLGRPSDPEKAKFWYLRAKQLGEPEAQVRLDRLTSRP